MYTSKMRTKVEKMILQLITSRYAIREVPAGVDPCCSPSTSGSSSICKGKGLQGESFPLT